MKNENLVIEEIFDENNSIFKNLIQYYEAEFSNITRKEPNKDGIFSLDVKIHDQNRIFIAFYNKKPAGFSIGYISSSTKAREILEFYVLPCYRRMKLGKYLSYFMFDTFRGNWEVKQLPEAQKAYLFWHHVIKEYTKNNFEEDTYVDDYWGKVSRQRFVND